MEIWQASLAIPIRMRLDPSKTEVMQESLDFSESCRVNNLAGSDDLFIWMGKVCAVPSLAKLLEGPVHPPRSLFQNTLKELKLTWKGAPLSCGQSLWSCSQYVLDADLKKAWLNLVGCSPNFNTLDKLYRMIQTAESWTGEKGQDVLNLLVWAWSACHNLIVFREVLEKDCTATGLFGRTPKTIGIIQALFVKRELCVTLLGIYKDHQAKMGGPISPTGGCEEIWSKLGTPEAVKQHFAPTGYCPKQSDDWEEDEDDPKFQCGIIYWCTGKFTEWQKTLTEPMDSTFAEILFGLHGKRWDRIVSVLATNRCSGQLSHGDQQKASLAAFFRSPTETRSDLHIAFDAFQEAVHSKPMTAQAGKYKDGLNKETTIGGGRVGGAEDDDPHANGEGDADELAERKEKQEVLEKLSKWRLDHVKFHCLEGGKTMDFADTTLLNKILQQTTFQKDRMQANSKRLWLIPLDLTIPMIQAWAAERKDKDFYARHIDFAKQRIPDAVAKILTWVFSVRSSDRDWVVFCDGRFKQATKVWIDACEGANVDLASLEDLHLGYTDYAEGDFRTPQRRLGWASNKSEKLFVCLPHVKRSALPANPRSDFNQCGEESSFETQYTGIAMRSLSELPMLNPQDSPPQGPLPLEHTMTNLKWTLGGGVGNQTISRQGPGPCWQRGS